MRDVPPQECHILWGESGFGRITPQTDIMGAWLSWLGISFPKSVRPSAPARCHMGPQPFSLERVTDNDEVDGSNHWPHRENCYMQIFLIPTLYWNMAYPFTEVIILYNPNSTGPSRRTEELKDLTESCQGGSVKLKRLRPGHAERLARMPSKIADAIGVIRWRRGYNELITACCGMRRIWH